MAFAIIKFLQTEEVAVVPIHWLREDKCLWPPTQSKNVLKFIDRGIAASEAWDLYSVQTLGVFDLSLNSIDRNMDLHNQGLGTVTSKKRSPSKLTECSRNSLNSQNGENLSSELDSSLNSQSTERNERRSKNNGVGSLPTKKRCVKNFLSESLINSSQKQQQSSSTSLLDSLPNSNHNQNRLHQSGSPAPVSAFERHVLRELNILKSKVDTVINGMDSLYKLLTSQRRLNEVGEADQVIGDILKLLPLDNIQDLQYVEGRLDDENSANQVVLYLSRIGGENCEQAIKFMLRKMFTDQLAYNFSFHGIRDKMPFKSLKIYQIIIRAIRTHAMWMDAMEITIIKVIANWLRHAKTKIVTKMNETNN